MTHSERWQRLQGPVLLLVIAVLAVAALLGGRAIGATVDARGATAIGAKGVDINHFAFHPPTLHVKRGGKVTFTNSQNVTHTATSGSFDTKKIAPGSSVTVRFAQKGTFVYHCKIHPFMKGKIVVE
jgi:plastocyanin